MGKELVDILKRNYVPTFIAVGDILPVALGARSGGSFFYDDLLFEFQENSLFEESLKENPDLGFLRKMNSIYKSQDLVNDILSDFQSIKMQEITEEELKGMVEDLYRRFCEVNEFKRYKDLSEEMGIISVPFPFFGDMTSENGILVVPRIYFLKEEPNIAEMIEKNVKEALCMDIGDYSQLDGELHDYNKCCIHNFVRVRKAFLRGVEERDKDLEKKWWEFLHRWVPNAVRWSEVENTDKDKGAIRRLKLPEKEAEIEENIFMFYSEEFYPCSKCEAAKQRGKTIFKVLKQHIPEKLAIDYFYYNYWFRVMEIKEVEMGKEEPYFSYTTAEAKGVKGVNTYLKPLGEVIEIYENSN